MWNNKQSLELLECIKLCKKYIPNKMFYFEEKKGISTGHEAWYMCDTFSYVSDQWAKALYDNY